MRFVNDIAEAMDIDEHINYDESTIQHMHYKQEPTMQQVPLPIPTRQGQPAG